MHFRKDIWCDAQALLGATSAFWGWLMVGFWQSQVEQCQYAVREHQMKMPYNTVPM